MAETATAPGTTGNAASVDSILTPTTHLGFTPGDARKLAPWSQIAAYFQLLGTRSPRVHTEVLGNSTEGRPFLLSIITSEETHARLDHYRDVQAHLADPRGVQRANNSRHSSRKGRQSHSSPARSTRRKSARR